MKLSAGDVIVRQSKTRLITGFLIYFAVIIFGLTPQSPYFIPGMILPIVLYGLYYSIRVNDIEFVTEGDDLVVKRKRILLDEETEKYPLNNGLNVTLAYEEHERLTNNILRRSENRRRDKIEKHYMHHLYIGEGGGPAGKMMEMLNLTDMSEIFKTKDDDVINFVERLSEEINVSPTYSNTVTEQSTDNPDEYRKEIENFQAEKGTSIFSKILRGIVFVVLITGLILYYAFRNSLITL